MLNYCLFYLTSQATFIMYFLLLGASFVAMIKSSMFLTFWAQIRLSGNDAYLFLLVEKGFFFPKCAEGSFFFILYNININYPEVIPCQTCLVKRMQSRKKLVQPAIIVSTTKWS